MEAFVSLLAEILISLKHAVKCKDGRLLKVGQLCSWQREVEKYQRERERERLKNIQMPRNTDRQTNGQTETCINGQAEWQRGKYLDTVSKTDLFMTPCNFMANMWPPRLIRRLQEDTVPDQEIVQNITAHKTINCHFFPFCLCTDYTNRICVHL